MTRRKQLRPGATRTRLAIETLEARDVPASTITIDGNVLLNTNISAVTTDNVTTFTATGLGAMLDVDAIEAEFTAGNDVVVDTGTGGAGDAGNIIWPFTNVGIDDLNYSGADFRSLTLRTSASSLSGDISITEIWMYLGQRVHVTLDTSAPTSGTKNIDLLGGPYATRIGLGGGSEAASVTLIAGTGDITTTGGAQISTTDGDITLSGDSVTASGFFGSTSGNVVINPALTVVGSFTANAANVTLAGTVNSGDLFLTAADTITLGGAVGATTPLTSLNIDSGEVSFAANNISAAVINLYGGTLGTGPVAQTGTITGNVNVGNGIPFAGTLSASTIVGNVTVSNAGKLAPGGDGTVGTMNINGSLTFSGGELEVDLVGATTDVVKPTGAVSINPGVPDDSRLLLSGFSFVFPNATPVKIIDATGAQTGTFFDAVLNALPNGTDIYLGLDVAKINYVAGAPGAVTLTQATGLAGGTFKGAEADGTGYEVKLTGGGDLFKFGGAFLARGTTTKSTLSITTKANASDDQIDLDKLQITGSLGAFKAPKANLTGSLDATETVKSITLNKVNAPITLGGTPDDKTSITVDDMDGSFTTPGVLSTLTAKRSAIGDVNAVEVGTVKVTDTLGGDWVVTKGIKGITAGAVDDLELTAKFLGTVKVNGTKTLSGDISDSLFTLTGDDGTKSKNGLKSLSAKGTVEGTTIDVKLGNVGSVSVGRFIDSDLFLNYTETLGGFNVAAPVGGAFGGGVFTLGSFTTTAKTIGNPDNPFNASFSGSRIAADTIRKVKLSGVDTDNGGNAFGIKFRTAFTKMDVQVTGDSAPGTILKNTKLIATSVGTAGPTDFFFIDV